MNVWSISIHTLGGAVKRECNGTLDMLDRESDGKLRFWLFVLACDKSKWVVEWMKGKYEGLWAGRTGWYISKPFLKKDIADLLKDGERKRIILRYNKYYEKDENKPRFIFAFANADEARAKVTEVPFVSLKDIDDGTQYVTVEEAISYARRNYDGRSDECDIYCSCDLHGKTITEIMEEQEG